MLKFLKGVVGSGGGIKDLPYNIGDSYSSSWGAWTHYRGSSKEDNSPVSIFSFTSTSAQDGRLSAARNGVKRLRTVRHPNVLSFLHSTEVESNEGSILRTTIYIVTEPVMPLADKVKELNLEGTQRNEYYAWGLHQISKAVSFLNNDCKLVHGNVCLAAVVVTATLDWKLHAFDILSEFDGANPDANAPMLPFAWMVGSQYKAMEFVKSDWNIIRQSPPWALDSWGLGCLIYELFSNTSLMKTEELRNTALIPKTLLPDYQRLLSSTPSRRLNSSKLIDNSEFFNNKLVETIQFMEVLNLKDSVEKDSFFRKLVTLADQLPRQIVLKKLLPVLASALEFGSASAPALNPLLKMGSWLSVEELTSKVIPTVIKLFASNDRAIRVGLLQNIEHFGNALSNQVVDEQVFAHVATGFSDTSPFLRELTLKSMLILAPKLSQRTLSGSLLKHLSRLQVDEEPAIRTNTTILLGNITGHLNEATRKRVLLNAFTVRALRDGFAPARAAGIMALTATSKYYDVIEIATKVLPNMVALTIDPDSDVRAKAFQATESFLQMVKEFNSKTAGDTGVNSTTSVTNGLLGWAVSSLTATTKSKPSDDHHGVTAAATTAATATVTATATEQTTVTTTAAVPVGVASSSEGWGEIEDNGGEFDDRDGWEDMEDDGHVSNFDSMSRIQSAQQRPLQAFNSNTSVPAAISGKPSSSSVLKMDGDGDDDGDGDPWAAITAPTPSIKPKTKPLVSSSSSSSSRGTKLGQHVSLDAILKGSSSRGSRGRGTSVKLGAQRISRTDS